jgi:hypothetical protein
MEPMSLNADAVAKNLTIMMEVKAANHALDCGVMGVRVPTTSVCLAVNDAREGVINQTRSISARRHWCNRRLR